MAMPADEQENARPYGPPANVTTVLQRLRTRNLPERIDAEFLRDCLVPEGTLNRTLFGLRFLGLISDAGAPSQQLRAIHTATDEEYQQILSSVLHVAYADVFERANLAEDGQDRILNYFRRYSPASQRQRMVIFFLGLCREAGIATLDTPRNRQMAGTQKRAPSAVTSKPIRQAKATIVRPATAHLERPQPLGIAPALEGLVRSLPEPGTPMLPAQIDQWLAMAKATLTFLYPPFKVSVAEPIDDGEDFEEDDES